VGPTRGSDEDARLFVALYPALRRFAGAVRSEGIDADDLVQEAVTRTLAVRALCDLDEPLAYLRTAVLRVASNVRRSKRRADARLAQLGPPDASRPDTYPSDLADLWQIAPTARAVLFLTVVESHSYREAAELVGCTEDAARQMAHRARQTLRLTAQAESEAGDPA